MLSAVALKEQRGKSCIRERACIRFSGQLNLQFHRPLYGCPERIIRRRRARAASASIRRLSFTRGRTYVYRHGGTHTFEIFPSVRTRARASDRKESRPLSDSPRLGALFYGILIRIYKATLAVRV